MQMPRGDEISLRDYVDVILRRKKLILSTLLILTGATLIVCFFLPRSYQSMGVVEIGSLIEPVISEEVGIQKSRIIFSKEEAKQIILSQDLLKPIFEKYRDSLGIPYFRDFRNRISVKDIENSSYIEIAFRSRNAQRAKDVCSDIIEGFIRFSRPEYEKQLDVFRDSLRVNEEQIAATEKDIKNTDDRIIYLSSGEANIGPEKMSKILLLQGILSNIQTRLAEQLKEKHYIRTKLASAKEFAVINTPAVPEVPVFPKTGIAVAVSAVVGLLIGLFAAFFIEAVQAPRAR